MQYKYLIVGQGLAGTVLSFALLQRNIPHKVLDNDHKTAATLAAAGIINPITGRRYVKSWMIDELLPQAISTYTALGSVLGKELIKKSTIIRTFDNQSQANHWNESTSRPGYGPYVAEGENSYLGITQKPYGYGIIQQAYQVDVAEMIQVYREYLISKELLVIADFKADQLDYGAERNEISGSTFEHVIFCEGYKVIDNPFFNALPFQPARGECLVVETEEVLPEAMLRDTIFIAPRDKHSFWTGGGYKWDDFEKGPTAAFLEEWKQKLSSVWTANFKITDHRCGVRPSVKGRRPLIGRHQNYPRLLLFNGLGTKGTSLAPYWAEHFIDYLEKGNELSSEVDLKRFC